MSRLGPLHPTRDVARCAQTEVSEFFAFDTQVRRSSHEMQRSRHGIHVVSQTKIGGG